MQERSGYELTQELYKGSNSLVYRACREENKQPVILKMLRQAHPSPEKIARFKLEYDITRSLNAAGLSGVVQVYGLETKQHGWMMALEDFGGEALNRIVKRKHFSLAELLQLFIQMVDIIGQVHQQHVIHKDINPSNLVLNLNSGQLKVIDFGIATTLSRENPTIRNVNVLEGTLAYMSPEQTGRMNRVLDYRTDYYSLGVTFYELLAGELPFLAADALELVHCHIARQPVPLCQFKPDIPKPLSDIVVRLMAKNAEDRYQSAFSLKADLETCLSQWQAARQISPFPLCQQDVSDRFQLPQKLYGRQREIDVLLDAFERVGAPPLPQAGEARPGQAEVLLISGYTGIGKSALVQEVYKPITRRRGYFITGKFDLLKPDTPYASLLQAFRLLVRQLLAETESEVAAWREKLLAALGPNGQVIIAVIPEVELIIGPQPSVPDLSPVEAQNRFNFVFQSFIKVFTRAEHPLVLFLDDLQWADSASLKLLNVLTTASDSGYLFVIGAYRDNDITAAHPLLLTLEQIQHAGTPVNHISLSPLSLAHIGQLVADTLHCPLAEARPLAELVLAKTNGNPFFINEFMKSLYADELLAFDYQLGRWQWDLEQIQAQDITDNVAELMGRQVQKLDEKTQRVMKLAACIGSQFDLRTLSIVCEQPAQETAANLWPAVLAGLVLPLGDAYKLMNLDVVGLADEVEVEYRFAHDQIQQAAYVLIPEEEKHAVHLRVGQLLLQHAPGEEQGRSIFDIVNHLNLGRALVHDRSQRHELARLNLQAGRKAKVSAAYQPALTYLQIGLEMLSSPIPEGNLAGDDRVSWEDAGYDLALALHVEAAEAACLNACYEQMERWVEVVLQQAVTLLDKVRAYEILIQAYIAQNKWPEAMQTGLFVLRLLKINFPEKPKLPQILLGLAGVKLVLAGTRIQNLQDLPEMRDPIKLAAMRILRVITGAIFVSAPELFPLIVFKQVNLSVRYGNTAESALAYATYGIIMCGVVGDIKSGYAFGQLALKVLERFNARQLEAQILFVQYFFILPWKEHLTETLKPLLLAYQSGLETGDLEFAANPISVYVIGLFFTGRELSGFEQEMASFNEVLLKLKQERPLYLNNLYWQASLNLTRAVRNPVQLVGERYNENQMLPLHLEANDLNATCHLYLIRMILAYLFQDYPLAVESAENFEKYSEAFTGMYTVAIARFYDSLAYLAIFPTASKSVQKRILKKIAANQKKMKKWAGYAPMNFLHKFYLVEAERARVLGQNIEARSYYDQAIELARQHQYVNEEALAGELAAQFCLAGGQIRLAQYYLHDAYYAYQRWGATAKANDLERRYPQLLTLAATQETSLTTSSTGRRVSSTLDLTSVLKASQAISSEIVLDRLLTTLMKIVIENAGAQSGYLILDQNGQPAGDPTSQWVIEARGEINQPEVAALQSAPVSTSEELAVTIVNYVARTKESVVLDDASHEGVFTQDPYIVRAQPKSILCMPLLNQGKLNGILYLENNLATAAFTPDRLQVLTLLSGQAAISVENARLYTRQVELTNAASRFIPHGFLAFLQKTNIVDVKLGDQVQRNMAILVSDIRSFTTLSEKMTPQANFDFVNTYLGHVSPIISQHNGLIVKYMGDGIMAVFPGQVEDGLNAALTQQKQVARYNVERRQQGEVPIQIGIGLHAGTMMLGTVGETQRMQLDLFSDTVNSAARLEGLTKRFGVGLVISAEAIAQLKDPTLYHLRFLGKVPVKGRQKMLSVFEIFDSDPDEIVALKLETRIDFEQGLSLYYDWQFADAQVYFEQVLQRFPQDKAAQFYLQQMAEMMEARPAPSLEFSSSE